MKEISHYTVQHRSGSGEVVKTQIADCNHAWAFMRELDAMGEPAGFPQAVFK